MQFLDLDLDLDEDEDIDENCRENRVFLKHNRYL